MSLSFGSEGSGRRWLVAALAVIAGAVLWVGLQLFEDLVTADMRWGLWVSSAALSLVAAAFGARRSGAWTPWLLTAPLIVFYGIPAARDFALFWPFLPLWLASAFVGWWSTTRRGSLPVLAALSLAVALAGFGGWIIPRGLAAELNQYLEEPAPDFVLTNLDGSPYPGDELAGKVVVLDFFATWCVPCRAELPRIESVRRDLADRDDIVILVVGDGDSGDTIEQVAAFAHTSDLGLPFAWDPDGRAHDAFGFWNIPALAVIDRQGRVRLKRVGYNAGETGFEKELSDLLKAL